MFEIDASQSRSVDVSRHQPTSTATRSLYQPQDGQTVCGSFAAAQRGHTLRAGAPSFQAPARWLRVFILDFFFLGTATVDLPGAIGLHEVNGDASLSPTWRAEESAGFETRRRLDPAIDPGSGVEDAFELVECIPAQVGHRVVTRATGDVAVDTALRAQPGAVVAAQR